jgi:hypothetical protein
VSIRLCHRTWKRMIIQVGIKISWRAERSKAEVHSVESFEFCHFCLTSVLHNVIYTMQLISSCPLHIAWICLVTNQACGMLWRNSRMEEANEKRLIFRTFTFTKIWHSKACSMNGEESKTNNFGWKTSGNETIC